MACSGWGPCGAAQSLVIIAMAPSASVSLPGTGVMQVAPYSTGTIQVFKGTDLAPLLTSNGIQINTTGVYEIRASYQLTPGTSTSICTAQVWVNSTGVLLPQHYYQLNGSAIGLQFGPTPPFYAQLTAGNIVGQCALQNSGASGTLALCSLSIFGPIIAP